MRQSKSHYALRTDCDQQPAALPDQMVPQGRVLLQLLWLPLLLLALLQESALL